MSGNTPTGVGKTADGSSKCCVIRKHPHGRGEDMSSPNPCAVSTETPPRAWGRRSREHHRAESTGNTPTGVGKTISTPKSWTVTKKHPHGRGEDSAAGCKSTKAQETPPRAWGRHRHQVVNTVPIRNTPTGVGKTPLWRVWQPFRRKHPHGRGEDPVTPDTATRLPETPPRAWGRPSFFLAALVGLGNTPTGVGKTRRYRLGVHLTRKHPHGRGEDWPLASMPSCFQETPPRAWGRPWR